MRGRVRTRTRNLIAIDEDIRRASLTGYARTSFKQACTVLSPPVSVSPESTRVLIRQILSRFSVAVSSLVGIGKRTAEKSSRFAVSRSVR